MFAGIHGYNVEGLNREPVMGLFDKITIKVNLISLVKAIKWIRRRIHAENRNRD